MGCTKISDACAHCSALRDAQRLSHNPNPKIKTKYAGVVANEGRNWTGKINFSKPDLLLPLTWSKPLRIFPNYTSDWCHKDVPDKWRDNIFGVMALANQHTYQMLTKRADVARRYLLATNLRDSDERRLLVLDTLCQLCVEHRELPAVKRIHKWLNETNRLHGYFTGRWPLAHVWVGFSAENQSEFDKRWADFKYIAEAGWTVTVSAEPLLGRIELPDGLLALGKRTQVIAGGESGKLARPSNPRDFRHLRDQCNSAGVPFYFKQWGEYSPRIPVVTGTAAARDAGAVHYLDGGKTVMYRIGKKRAGRLLDGVEWSEFPEQTTYIKPSA